MNPRAMTTLRLGFALAFALALVACDAGVPPAGNYATVSGRVTDAASGAGIPNATVFVNGVLSAKTDASGDYKITPVPTGPWSYSVDAGGNYAKANSDAETPLTPGEKRTFAIPLKHR